MIKFKCRPALHTKMVIEYCDSKGISVPDHYQHIRFLADDDKINYYTVNNILHDMEVLDNNPYFFFELEHVFRERLIPFTIKILDFNKSAALNLLDFTHYYSSISDLAWSSIVTATSVTLVAARGSEQRASKYDDLFIYFCMIEIFKPLLNNPDDMLICLPYGRDFYSKYINVFEQVKFNHGCFSVTINKDEGDKDSGECLAVANINELDRVGAAANSIPSHSLSLFTLAQLMNVAPRSLQRELKLLDSKPQNIIDNVKVNYIISRLGINKGNIKLTAYECGFTDMPTFSRFFTRTTGLSPKAYVKARMMIS
ncbi:helix-turn-helix domain-containing protein [Shewanella sp. MF05960]|uniref:helix-turn-helix domain-containing protein n=1 Tax=Shewanella sp. MF05960 TaxID=3434874 RepID=UPI003D78E5B9